MCGIVGVVRRRATRPVPDAADLVHELDRAARGVRRRSTGQRLGRPDRRGSTRPPRAVEVVDAALRGVPGVRGLLGDPQAALADRATGSSS